MAWSHLRLGLVPSWCGARRTIWNCWKPWGIPSTPRAAAPATSSVAREGPKIFGLAKMLEFRQIKLFCFGNRLLKHKMAICSENLGVHGPLGPTLAMPMPATLLRGKAGVKMNDDVFLQKRAMKKGRRRAAHRSIADAKTTINATNPSNTAHTAAACCLRNAWFDYDIARIRFLSGCHAESQA